MKVISQMPSSRRIFVRPSRTPERVLLGRASLLIGLVLSAFIAFWVDREGLRDQIDGHVSFGDVAYFTAVTISTVGYGDIVPVSDRARLIDTVFVTPLRLLVWLIFLGTAYELVVQRWLEGRRMSRIQKTLSEHLIVCGFGHSGRTSVQEAVARGTLPEQILVMDRDSNVLPDAADLGHVGLLGDATRRQDLTAAGVTRARAVLVCVGRDDAAILTVLTVRQLSASVRIICSVAEQDNVQLIRQAGADAIVAPSMVGGYLMADSITSSHVSDYISDLMCSAGRVRLIERRARPEEVGLSMRQITPGIVVRLVRGAAHIGVESQPQTLIEAGDLLLEIEPAPSQSGGGL